MQMIRNMRAFRGESGSGIKVQEKTISRERVDEGWNTVTSGVADFAGRKTRDFINSDGSASYQNTSKRNDIVEIRAAQDSENIYILLTAAEEITRADGQNWMNVWLNVGGGPGVRFRHQPLARGKQGERRTADGRKRADRGRGGLRSQRQDHTVYPSQIAFGRYYFAATQGDG